MVIYILSFLAVLLQTSRVSGQVQLEPLSLAVLRGGQAQFNCSTTVPWVALVWSGNSGVVISVSVEFGILENSDRYTLVNYTTARSTAWGLVLWDAQRSDAGDITCDFQNIGRQTASLSVQEDGTVSIDDGNVTSWRGDRVVFRCQASDWFPEPRVTWAVGGVEVSDLSTSNVTFANGLFQSTSALVVQAEESAWVECQASIPTLSTPRTDRVYLTVGEDSGGVNRIALIAALVSVFGSLLLLLIIIAIVCCCLSRRKSRRAEDERGNTPPSEEPMDQRGQDNLGYTWPDTGVSKSELRSDPGQTNSISAHQTAVDPRPREAPDIRGRGHFHNDLSAGGTKTIRQATIV